MKFGSETRSVLRIGLDPAGTSPAAAPMRPDPAQSAALLSAAVGNRVVGLLCAAVTSESIVLAEGDDLRLATVARESAAVAVTLERFLLDTAPVLDSIQAPFRVLKGPALAHTAYPDPSWRAFGDIDLLVEGTRMTEIVGRLEREGFRRVYEPVGRRYEERVGKSVTLVDPHGWELDLHRTIAHGPWGLLIDVDDLWDAPRSVVIGGVELPTLSPELHLAHALVHIGLGSALPRWSNLRDVAQLCDRADLDRTIVVDLLDRWQARPPSGVAANWVTEATGVDLGWLGPAHPLTAREQRWMHLYRQSPQPFRRLTIEAVRAPATLRRRVEHLVALRPLLRPQRRSGQSVL